MNMHMTRHTTQLRQILIGLVVTMAVMASVWTVPAADAQDLAFPDSATTEQMLADQLVAMAWMSFGQESAPRPDQLERARVLLDMAAELSPDDEGMWELRASLARSLEDQALLIDSLRNYLRLQPKDDVALLELIQARLSGIEALDKYLETLERFLRAESASQFSAPLRSRLATLAAQAAQEIGDSERSAAWLGYAVKLDPVNPAAAQMVYQMTIDREGTPRQKGTALVNLLKASPVDASIRIELANLLMQQAVYVQALDQFNVAMDLVDMQSRLELITQYTLCLIASGREDEVPPLLLELQLFLKQMADSQNPDLVVDEDEEPEPPSLDDLPPLPATLEFARLILMHEVNPVAAQESFQRLQDASEATEDPEVKQDLLKQLVWIGAVFNQDPVWVQKRIDALGPEDEQAQLAAGWLALRSGDSQAARSIFEALGDDDIFARLGLASLPGLDEDQRAQAYQQMVWDNPASMGSIVAARRLHKMGKPISPTGQGVPLRVLVDDMPRQLWTPALTVSPWVRLQVSVSPGSFGFMQPMKAKVTVRNATRIPLSVGQGGAILPTLMVSCSPSVRNEPLDRLPPTFFGVGRQLTLPPGGSMQTEIRLDRFGMGQLVANYPAVPISFSASAMLDPRPLPNGAVTIGPLGASAYVGSLLARGMPATPSNLQLWMKDLDGTDPAVRALAIARLLTIARQPAESTESLDFRNKTRDLISERYPSLDSNLQAWTVRFMLPDVDGEPVAPRVIDLAQRSDDPLVRIVYLVMNTSSPDSPALTDAIRHDDPTIRTFAQALKTGLEEDAKLAADAGTEPDAEDSPFGDSFDPLAPVTPLPESDQPWMP